MKRTISLIVIIALTFTLCCGIAEARASLYLSDYGVLLDTGSSSGELVITYSVDASKLVTSIGVSKIEIYNENDTKVRTITGSESNGLIRNETCMTHNGEYSVYCTPGVSYYAKVTVFAGNSTGSDSRTVTTTTEQAGT